MNPTKLPEEPAIAWRLRPDLQIQQADMGTDATRTIKDPLRLTYFYVEAEEMAFLKLLDGRNSMSEIMRQLRQDFPESEFAVENLRQFLLSAVNGGLLMSCAPGHSQRLNAIRKKQSSQAFLRRSLSLMSHRFRGIDPSAILTFLDRKFGWVFQVHYLIFGLLFLVSAGIIVLARRSQLENEIPEIGSLFTPTNLPVLAISFFFVKILHELGHGLTCRHYGGECHELGVLVVGFMPLLYCDVSDSWLQQDRRKRMLVSAAGIGTELFLAAAFAMLWAMSRHGALHTFFLNVMLISSLNTVLVNGNPLLKYDGYYVVSDWLRLPNLASESRAAAIGVLDQMILGSTRITQSRHTIGFRLGLAAYGAASLVYRVLVITALLWFMHETLKAWHLEFLTSVLIISVLAGVTIAARRGVRERVELVRGSFVRRSRAIIGLCVTSSLLLLGLFVPFPYSVTAPFTLTPGVSLPVFALEDGEITARLSEGDPVRQGDVIAILNNPGLQSSLAHSHGEFNIAKVRANALSTQRSASSQAARSLPLAEKAVQSREAKLVSLLMKVDNLTIVSPIDGTIFPARNRPRPQAGSLEGSGWFGQPLNPETQSAWMTRQTLLCWVGSEEDLRAICLLPQEDIDLIGHDAAVTLIFASMPAATIEGRVCQRKTIPETTVDRELIANRMISVSPESGQPKETFFGVAVSVNFESSEVIPSLYSSGHARIECAPVSLAGRAWRFICHTFTFQ